MPVAALAGSSKVPSKKVRKPRNPETIGRAVLPDLPVPAPLVDPFHKPIFSAETRGRAALSLINFPWQELGYTVKFMGRRPGFRALTLVDERRIEVYVKLEETPEMLAFDLAHEFGHLIDLKFNTPERRRQWLKMRGIKANTPWFGPSACPDYETPAGDFAETFAYLLLGPGSYHSRMAPPPPPEQIRELAEFCKISSISTAHAAVR